MLALADIYRSAIEAEARMDGMLADTPLRKVSLSNGRTVYLKLENRQHTGSFKARGSLNKVLRMAEGGSPAPVITASTGNHALGVASALERTGMQGIIVLPEKAAPNKLRKLERYHVNLEFVVGSSLDAEIAAKARAAESGMAWVSPYNDPDIIAGQGTIGLEILRQLPEADIVFITVGGGGLVSGIGGVLKHRHAGIRIIGCQPEHSPEMKLSVEAGHIVDYPETPTLSDGSAGGIEPGAITFPVCQEVIDGFCLASEEEIRQAIRFIYKETGEVIEGAAGVAVACAEKVLSGGRYQHPVVVICGGNIEEGIFNSITGK